VTSPPPHAWHPGDASALRRLLAHRARVRATLGQIFDDRGSIEVDTPVLSTEVLPEAHIDPIPVSLDGPDGVPRWLQASPEALMKRLLAAGSGPIHQFARSFRAGERGALHDVEFVLLEWYEPGATLDSTAPLVEEVCTRVLGTTGLERLTCREAFARHAGIDWTVATLAEWRDAGRRAGVLAPHGAADSPETWFEVLLSETVGPRLGRGGRPTSLEAWPTTHSALARLDPADDRIALRFELFVEGVELANGWEEDTSRELLARRIDDANRARRESGRPALPVPHRLLGAHGTRMPGGVGAALGFDRLVMLAAGCDTIDGARPFPGGSA
jgi:lysyl-tRNA synthetase class 2